jgi:hypothetical protein
VNALEGVEPPVPIKRDFNRSAGCSTKTHDAKTRIAERPHSIGIALMLGQWYDWIQMKIGTWKR